MARENKTQNYWTLKLKKAQKNLVKSKASV